MIPSKALTQGFARLRLQLRRGKQGGQLRPHHRVTQGKSKGWGGTAVAMKSDDFTAEYAEGRRG
jgi:hypothetical protein